MDEVLLFIPSKGDAEKRLLTAVEEIPLRVNLRIVRDAESLRRRLVPGGSGVLALVILAATKEDLTNVLPLRELLLNFRILMILPDSDNVTMAAGWRLWPRFVSYADGDFHDVAGVLHKIAGSVAQNRKGAATHEVRPVRNRTGSPLHPR